MLSSKYLMLVYEFPIIFIFTYFICHIHYKLTVMCVCVCVCVCSIDCEGLICLDQLENQGTDHQCYIEYIYFLCQVPSLLLKNAAPNLSN